MKHNIYRRMMARAADLAWILVSLFGLLIAVAAMHGRPTVIIVGLIVASLLGLVGIGICVRAGRMIGRSDRSDEPD